VKIPAGQRIFARSSITNEEYEYFIPSIVSNIEASPQCVTLFSPLIDENAFLPHAAIMVSRGRTMLSAEVIEQSRSLVALTRSWRGKSLDIKRVAHLHAIANGGNSAHSAYRDSMVWVDGLRPVDAKLIPGPASTVLPLMHDYIAFIRRSDIDIKTKLALAHYQILMIHPFFDGNGRLSRLLAVINAQPVLGTSRAFAIAAVLAMHRRALRDLFHEVRAGDLRNYLAYWEKLISWSSDCVAKAAHCRELAVDKISQRLSMFKSIERLAAFLIERPIFTQSQLARDLRLSEKLGSRYIDQLSKHDIIELHPSTNGVRCFRCPISVEYFRQVIRETASSSMQLLPQTMSSNRP
jgi:Fic family protein